MSSLPLFDSPALQAAPTKTLRPYQARAIVNIRGLVLQDRKRILCVAPTAAGKMVVCASIIQSATLPVLFVSHRKEILDQCASQLAALGITNIGVIRGNDERYNPYASVQIGSIATLARRDRPFLGKQIIIIIDEAHRTPSDSYLDLLAAYPDAIVLGFTATPVRLDGRPLGGDLFGDLVQIAIYDELLKRRDWLVAPDVFAGRERADVQFVRRAGADFDEAALAEVMHTERLEGNIVEHWLTRAHLHPVFTEKGERVPQKFVEGERRRTILFAVNIEHSQSLAARFEREKIKVAHLDGNTPETQREAIFRDLSSGELKIVCNCQVTVEGIDIPPLKCVIHACPTHSQTKWRQTVGRIMRPWENVTPLLLDHAGNFDRLGCPFEDLAWSLKEKPKRYTSKMPMRLCPACFAYVEPGKIFCPFCGAEFKTGQFEMPQETKEILEQRQTEPEALKWAFFWRQVVKAKQFGFKPGFASAIFKENYGVWPPRHWSEKIKADFSVDGLWQAALERRLARKAEHEERERQEEQAMSEVEEQMEATMEAMDVEGDDESFSGWLKEQGIE